MMIPEYMRFYSQNAQQALSEYAVTFFGLINAMFRIQAGEHLNGIMIASTAQSGKDGQATVDALKKQSGGLHAIIQEVRIAKKVRENK